MSDPKALLDRALVLIDKHLTQIAANKAPLGSGDAGTIERYAKLLITMTKSSDGGDKFDKLTDAELEALANGDDDNVGD